MRILLMLFLLANCEQQEKSKYGKAYSYIANDENLLAFFSINSNENLVVNDKPIPFNLVSISEDLILKHYIPDYSIFQELDEEQKEIEKFVMDSLENFENKANQYYREESIQINGVPKKNNGRLSIFFSEIFKGSLYVEILQTDDAKLGYKMAHGEAMTYNFIFDENGNIKNVLKGSIIHN